MSIRFNSRVTVWAVPALREMNDEEVKKVWYDEVDFGRLQLEVVETLRVVHHGENVLQEAENICVRGLEYILSRTHLEQRRSEKQEVMHAVLKEQERQRTLGINDIERLSRVSHVASRRAKEWALKMGSFDEANSSILTESN